MWACRYKKNKEKQSSNAQYVRVFEKQYTLSSSCSSSGRDRFYCVDELLYVYTLGGTDEYWWNREFAYLGSEST